ncbi:hypothetical protein BDN72DRAFT_173357 [Pluteus cervinus]|uniref:Uncharacterized protein n=1 Tax=Pluteus cervinus TaxID=181527 RepID=A0ACD3AJ77_9AGAR|nr:hypothetical protein BDN72DRAFT_173357 [Pluteus cervinus]
MMVVIRTNSIVTLRKSVAFIALFGFLTITFLLLAAAELSGTAVLTKAGGGVGVVTAIVAYYIGISELLSAEASPVFTLPLGAFKTD